MTDMGARIICLLVSAIVIHWNHRRCVFIWLLEPGNQGGIGRICFLTVSSVSSVSAVETGSQCKLICLKSQFLPRFDYPSGNKHEDHEDDDGIR